MRAAHDGRKASRDRQCALGKDRLNIALVCRDPAIYQPLAEQLTAARVAEIFASRRPSSVVRYDLPKLSAFNFVLDDVLEGGVNASLGLDGHGKKPLVPAPGRGGHL